jgi:hypothetical protein
LPLHSSKNSKQYSKQISLIASQTSKFFTLHLATFTLHRNGVKGGFLFGFLVCFLLDFIFFIFMLGFFPDFEIDSTSGIAKPVETIDDSMSKTKAAVARHGLKIIMGTFVRSSGFMSKGGHDLVVQEPHSIYLYNCDSAFLKEWQNRMRYPG